MKYTVTVSAYWHEGVKCKRGDIIEAPEGLEGARLQPYFEPIIQEVKPKRKRRTKAEIEAAKNLEVSREDRAED